MRRLLSLGVALAVLVSLAGTAHAIGSRAITGTATGATSNVKIKSFPRSYWTIGCLHLGAPNGGTSPKNFYQFRKLVDSLNVAAERGRCDALLISGDWAEDGIYTDPARAESLTAIRNAGRFPMYFALGNHEALASDTLNGLNPYTTAMARFPELFKGKEYYSVDTDYFRFIILNDIANYNVSDPAVDYRVNNPFNQTEPDGFHGMDHPGITAPTSPQRKFLTSALKNLDGRYPILCFHRPIYGSNAAVAQRQNFSFGARANGFMRYAEQQLTKGRRAEANSADQHVQMITEAMADSHLCTAGESGYYHIQNISGFGLRQIDTTSVLPAGTRMYKSYLGIDPNTGNSLRVRVSNPTVATYWNTGADPDLLKGWYVTEHQYWGDYVLLKTYRVWTANSAGCPGYNGAGHLYLVDTQVLSLDVRGGYAPAAAPATDAVPPNDITNLTAGTIANTSVVLGWTAPGDDGTIGTAASYDIRYSTSLITAANFASASTATGEPTPLISGSQQTFTLTGLTQGTTYFIAMKAADEVPNSSGISNVVQILTTAPDVTPPAAITNLQVTVGTYDTGTGTWPVTLTWTATGDDGNVGTGSYFDIRWASSGGASNGVAPLTSGNFTSGVQVSSPPTPGPNGTVHTKLVSGLIPASSTIYFAIKEMDEISNASPISNIVTFTTAGPTDATAPATVSDLAVSSATGTTLTASWTAPGDDATTGTASTYDIRYASTPTVLLGSVPVVGNGTFTATDYPLAAGNYAQAIQAGGSYPPSSAFTALNGQAQPEMHFIDGGTNPVTANYAACLSACAGASYQFHTLNNTYKWVASNRPSASYLPGSFGMPTGPATVNGNLVTRVFTGATVYVNRSTTSTVAYPGGTLSATGYAVTGYDANHVEPGAFPRYGGIFWGNLTKLTVDSLATWEELALNDANINGPTDGDPHIPAAPIDRISMLRKVTQQKARIGMSINGFDVFVSGSPSVPSIYFPLQVRTFHKCNAYNAWVKASDGTTPLEHTFSGIRVRYVDITNQNLRIWLAGQIDSMAQACQLDFLFIDQLEASLASEKAASPSTNWPTDAAWLSAWNDFMSRVNAGLPSASLATNEPTPAVAGTTQNWTLSGLPARARYWIRMRTADEVPNWSGFSNVATDTTVTNAGVVGTQVYRDFNTYCTTNFGALTESLVQTTFGSTPSFVATGDWVYPSRNSASIGYETSLPCRGFVEYGLTTSYGSRTPDEDRPFYNHLGHLTGLNPVTTYHYRLVATDEQGQLVTSADRTFTTGAFASAILVSSEGVVCNVAGATYLLTQDINASTRGISIKANGVTLDLNGHTITYDNAPPVGSGLQSDVSTSGVHFFLYNANLSPTTTRILNGRIVQGSNNGSGSLGTPFNPVAIYEGKVEVAGIDARWAGNDVNGLHNEYGTLYAHHNVLRDGGTVTTNRSQGIKAIYAASYGSTGGIAHNLIVRARHQGIMTKYGGSAPVAYNEVYLDSYATNGYGIGAAQEIANNKIFGTGYHAVGIGFLVDTAASPIAEYVHDNFLFLQGEAPSLRDTEYGNDASVIGMRLTQYQCATAPYTNYLYTGNTIIVKGRNGTLSVRGVQFASSAYISNLNFTGNTIKCDIQDSSTRGACVTTQGDQTPLVQDSAGLPVYYTNNTFLTNDVFVRFGDQYSVGGNANFRHCTFTKFGSLASFKPIRIGYLGTTTVSACGITNGTQYWDSYNNRFIDSVLGSGVAFTAPSVEGTPGGRRDYSVGHSLYVRALGSGGTPLASRTITVYDNIGLSYTTTTDASGIARVELIDDFYEALNNASSITHTTRSGWNLRTSGYQNYVLSGGELSTSYNAGSPVDIQFVP